MFCSGVGFRCWSKHLLRNSKPIFLNRSTYARGKPRIQVNPETHIEPPPVKLGLIARCGLFTFVSTNVLFVGSAIWGFEAWRSHTLQMKNPEGSAGFTSMIRKKIESFLGRSLRVSDIYWVIVGLNLLVYLGHKSSFSPIVLRYFTNSPYGPTPALSMLLSTFSHHGFFHLFVNMYVLHSFSSTMISIIGVEDFMSLFIGGGIFASFFSILSKSARRCMIPSIGASGGICAILGAFCLLQPNAHLCIPFVVDIFPHSFSAYTAAYTILAIEFFAAFVLSSRSPLDHAAHLGGLIYGMYYGISGAEAGWKRRHAIVSWWRNIRGV